MPTFVHITRSKETSLKFFFIMYYKSLAITGIIIFLLLRHICIEIILLFYKA